MNRLAAAAVLVTIPVSLAWAQGAADHQAHHPGQGDQPAAAAPATPPADTSPDTAAAPSTAAPSAGAATNAPATPPGGGAQPPAAAGGGMMGSGMMGGAGAGMMGAGMMNMMGGASSGGGAQSGCMARMADMAGSEMGGMATIDRVEGRIAFLRTELKITDAQASAWNTFADALRGNAKRLGEVRSTMAGAGDAPQGLAARLEIQEKWLSARLDGTREIRSAFTGLSALFSDEQKKTADEILAPHIGMTATMPMTMSGAGMPSGKMAPRPMPNGRMGAGGPGRMMRER